MNVAEERLRVARMVAECRVDHDWRAAPDSRFVAELWCNAIGEPVYGYGPDEWTAVQAAHALRELAKGRGRSCRPGAVE